MVGVFDVRYLPDMMMLVTRWGFSATAIIMAPRIFQELAASDLFNEVHEPSDNRELAVKGYAGVVRYETEGHQYQTISPYVYTDAFFGDYSVLAANEIFVAHAPILLDLSYGDEPNIYDVICDIDTEIEKNWCYGIITPEG